MRCDQAVGDGQGFSGLSTGCTRSKRNVIDRSSGAGSAGRRVPKRDCLQSARCDKCLLATSKGRAHGKSRRYRYPRATTATSPTMLVVVPFSTAGRAEKGVGASLPGPRRFSTPFQTATAWGRGGGGFGY